MLSRRGLLPLFTLVAGGGLTWLPGSAEAPTARTEKTPRITIFGSAVPRVPSAREARATEVGVRFRSSRAGYILGIRFYKGARNTGRHVGTLWSASGARLARATFSAETRSGWQTVAFAEPVAIKANTSYVASYHAPRGRFARKVQGFRKSKRRAPLTATGSRYIYAAKPRFPRRTERRANYYVDVIYTATRPGSRPSTAPPAVVPPAPPGDALPPLGTPSCVEGASIVSTAAEVRSNLQAGRSVCITAPVGDLNLSGLTSDAVRYVGTQDAGSIGEATINGSSRLTLRVRMRAVVIRGGSSFITVEQSVIGGTPTERVDDQLVFMPDNTTDVIVRDNDIGWTRADDSGNTGYGCRCYGDNARFQFVRNKVHDIAADGFQGAGGDDVLIDRNEIGPVGANPDSNEHSDNIQITGNDNNLRITNNWIHHQGYFDGSATYNAGATYIHGGSDGSLLYENNLVQASRGRVEIGGLGTGGTSRSNITIRRNTFVDLGQEFTGFPGFEWDLDSGTGNLVERNVAIDPDGGFAQDGSASAATFIANLWGRSATFDASGNCTSNACNPAGEEPIGFRKPPGVHW